MLRFHGYGATGGLSYPFAHPGRNEMEFQRLVLERVFYTFYQPTTFYGIACVIQQVGYDVTANRKHLFRCLWIDEFTLKKLSL